ncbi:MAG: cupin domain-containing protein [Betaproteobacteria bacterium]|nr:MAG: cupin domain-containing protein [Betaproteobacteria bacterium]
MNRTVLGTLTPAQFLRRHWQKKPLHVKGALPEIRDRFCAAELRALACREDVESRLVTCTRRRWDVVHGPFRPGPFKQPPGTQWSLLVQGVDLHDEKARALLEQFNFVPYARLDDVMLSLAPPGGGVGPHFDSYDVFLLQVCGRRRWRIGAQRDLRLVDGAPLRILRKFQPQYELEAGPGDLLYLPPQYAHDGIALTECITCSIGFRAPTRQELAAAFLQWLPDALHLEGRYRDPGLAPQADPAAIGRAMVEQAERMLSVRWGRRHVETFLGEYLTEPKPQVWFTAPRRPFAFDAFVKQARKRGIRLSLKTRMLYRGARVFINGESIVMPVHARNAIKALANERGISFWHSRSSWATRTVYEWYRAGYVDLGS